MAETYIADCAVRTSQGNLSQTVHAIQTGNIHISSRHLKTELQDVEVPLFLLPDFIEEHQESILNALRSITGEICQNLSREERKKTALLIGTTLVDQHILDALEAEIYEQCEYRSEKLSIDTYARVLSEELGLSGYTMTINTACTSSANALMEARNLIESNLFEKVIVLGVEVLSHIMSIGFLGMQLLSLKGSRPFDKNRDGLTPGEALAGVLLTKETGNWKFLGGYTNCDSINIAGVSEEGTEYTETMQEALRRTGLTPTEITAVKAHATGTPSSDESELNSMMKVFCEAVTFTALKPFFGHTIGACGALELAVFMQCVEEGFIPGTPSCLQPMEKEFEPIQQHQECREGRFMLNYFGFGGNNTSLIISKVMSGAHLG